MEHVRKKWQLNLVVESQHNQTKTAAAPFQAPADNVPTPAPGGEIMVSQDRMETPSQLKDAMERAAAPMKRVRATKQQVLAREERRSAP